MKQKEYYYNLIYFGMTVFAAYIINTEYKHYVSPEKINQGTTHVKILNIILFYMDKWYGKVGYFSIFGLISIIFIYRFFKGFYYDKKNKPLD